MKIAILTMHAARNYGAVLQTFALQHFLEKRYKLSAVVLNYVSTQRKNSRFFTKVIDKYKNSKIKSMLFCIAVFPTRLYSQVVFKGFLNRRINLEKTTVSTNEELKQLKYDADAFCVGSDQVWNPEHNDGIDKGFFLDFVPDEKKKFSYASSIGTKNISDVQKTEMKKLLYNFHSISYREYSSGSIFDEMGLDSKWVVDPTLLLNSSEWDEFATNKRKKCNYLLIYWFGNTKNIIEKARQIAKEKNLRIIRISTILKKYDGDDIVEFFPSPERFLQLFSDAEFVITDSFHGTAFSINYNKQFYSYPAREKDERFYSLFKMFDLYDRDLREEFKKLSDADINYDVINKRLSEMREISYKYLDNAING